MANDGRDPADEQRPSAVDSLVFSSQQEPRQQKTFQPTAGIGGFKRASTLTGAPTAARGMTTRATVSVRASGQPAAPEPQRSLPEPSRAESPRTAQPQEVVRTLQPGIRPAAARPAIPLSGPTSNERETAPGGEDSPLRKPQLTSPDRSVPNRGVLPAPARKRFVPENAGNIQTASPVQSATETGRQIVEAARVEGDRIVREAKRYIEAEREHARIRGAEEGKRDAAEMILHAHALRREILESAKSNALDLIFEIAAEVVQRELASEHGSVLTRIGKGLEKLLAAKQITITVHPDDLRFVRENISDMTADLGVSGIPQITASEAVRPGSARLETESTVVEASVESHLSAIRNYIERVVSHNIAEQEEELSGKTH